MKHIRKDYNERIQDMANLIPEDEPVFLLRAQDKHAPALVGYWADMCASEGNYDIAVAAIDHMKAMLLWQKTHGRKSPDAPGL